MKQKKSFIAFVALIFVGAAWFMFRQPAFLRQPTFNQSAISEPGSSQYITTPGPRQAPGGPYAPADPRWPERTRKLQEDPQYEWKTPIEFYGKVVDQDGAPVEGSRASITWTDMSIDGSSQMERISDASGKFSITGIKGKHMTVQVNKEGYHRQLSGTTSAFEYAGFWEPSYHIPDQRNPVVFRLRKKGAPAALATSSGKIVLEFGKPTMIPMPAGVSSATVVKTTVFENVAAPRAWRAKISVESGGVQETAEEFPFQAPEEGYRSSIDLDQSSPRPPGWQDLFQGGVFYIKTDGGYGMLKIEQIVGKKTLRYHFCINSKGDKNLEPE